jgi:L-lactate dehydrogenase (cytochrome)
VIGKRERDLRSGFSLNPKWSMRSVAGFARHPVWCANRLGKRALSVANFAGRPHRAWSVDNLDRSVTWKDVRAVADAWRGPFALKGVMSEADARAAADAGATAVIVSNHGGRQLDGAATPIDVLPRIVAAVGERLEVILDGGVRHGVHVLKALALGARACSVGRAYLYGLSAGGEAGVSRALEILRSEFVRAMQLSGCPGIDSIDGNLIRRQAWNPESP